MVSLFLHMGHFYAHSVNFFAHYCTEVQMGIGLCINSSYVEIYNLTMSNDKYNKLLESYDILSLDNNKLIKLILDRSYSKSNHQYEQPQITYQLDKIELKVIHTFFYLRINRSAIIFDIGISEFQFKNIVKISEKLPKSLSKAKMKTIGKSCKIKDHYAKFVENLFLF